MNQLIFNKIINELCNELKIKSTELSNHWIIKLEKNHKIFFIVGNQFDLNPSASAKILSDKVGTFKVLKNENIPSITHRLISDRTFICTKTISQNLRKTLKTSLRSEKYPLVIKPNHGSQGRNVKLCKTRASAIKTTLSLLKQGEDIAYSPYFPANFEYRCFFLDNKIHLIYKKKRNKDWRHNLSHGSIPELVLENSSKFRDLSRLAIQAGKALNIRFATIDILESDSGEIRVLEMNQGVTTTIFANSSIKNYELAKNIYRSALKSLFNLK